MLSIKPDFISLLLPLCLPPPFSTCQSRRSDGDGETLELMQPVDVSFAVRKKSRSEVEAEVKAYLEQGMF